MKFTPRQRAGSRGQSVVEFALLLPVMLLILLVAIDFGRLFFSYVQVTNASREAAAYAAADPTVSQASIAARAGQEANTQGQRGEGALAVDAPICQTAAAPPVTVSCATAASNNTGTGNQVTIGVRRRFTFFMPVIGAMFGNLTISSTSTSPVYNAPTPTPAPTATPIVDPCELVSDFTFDQKNRNQGVDFTDQSTPAGASGCKVTGWQWDFGQPTSPDNTSTLPSPTHDYDAQGASFTVTLTVTRSSGGSATFSQPVLTLAR